MTTAPCTTTLRLSRPLPERVLDRITQMLRGAASAWRAHAERRRAEREFEAVAQLNETMLRDIGAPSWMVAQAAARRDVHEMRMFELQFSRDIDRLHGLK
ncbi:hypothetical protein [Piscinibacter sp. XHJ-5]|uniref:hypothetical protein n=1 Tax=Piscinibacter sp. XHJ-5 TaxID=3037797 RepID=UPI0024530F25|nr:hypothetical protein [Piscinibacter sp. XHJ-5]